ncbi:hypothetical protein ACO0QE_004351 [Hanseniaspora vineae]
MSNTNNNTSVASMLEDIFKVYVDPSRKTDSNWTLIESEDFDGVKSLSMDHLDSIILHQLTEISGLPFYGNNPFQYLSICYNDCNKYKKILHGDNNTQDSNKLINDSVVACQDAISNYALILLQLDEFSSYGSQFEMVKYIIENLNDCNEFLVAIVHKAIEQEELLTVCNTLFNQYMVFIQNDVSSPQNDDLKLSMNDPLLYNQVLNFFEFLCSIKPIGSIITQVDAFDPLNITSIGKPHSSTSRNDPKVPINLIEQKSLLGTILRLSPLQKNVTVGSYKALAVYEEEDLRNNSSIDREITQIHETLQLEHNVIINKLFFILNKLFRSGNNTRSQLLNWLGAVLNKNHLRRGDHHDPRKLSSDSFMCNVSILMIKFSLPFLDIDYTKLDKIDMDYFKHPFKIPIDIEDETRMNSDLKEYKEQYSVNDINDPYDPNFISDCFYLSCTFLHYGIGGAILNDSIYERRSKQLKDELKKIDYAIKQKTRTLGGNAGEFVVKMFQETQKKIENQMLEMKSYRLSFQGFFIHKFLQMDVFSFICGVSTFLIRVVDPQKAYPKTQISLPLLPDQLGLENVDNFEYLRSNAPKPFKYFPEFMVDGLINYCQYINRYYMSPMIKNPRLGSFLELCTVLLRCPELISNPHLKSKIIVTLSIGCTPQRRKAFGSDEDEDMDMDIDDEGTGDFMNNGSVIPGFMMEVIETDEICLQNLLFSLLDFYVIVEKTGSSSQFYDKFNSRYYISVILEQVYKIPYYKKSLLNLVDTNLDFFTRFVARMLNDLTFLLDEAFTSLVEVHDCYVEIQKRKRGESSSNDEEESFEKLKARFLNAGSKAKSSCGLANKSMILFKIFTRDVAPAFTIPEIVDRLASMLNFNLKILVGPKCNNLIVKNPEKYSFEPKKLLKNLCSIYINLSNEENFILAVSKDERSFDKKLFDQAINNLYNRLHIVDADFAESLQHFVQNVVEQKMSNEQEELDMNDCPDEFLDPLMYTIMNDPVRLPQSNVVIDRSTIKQHLLSDSTDPFNRSPLKLEDVIPETDLKLQIEQYKKNKKVKN